ncbi:hypothetical protein EVAR_58897_1 [Eumeta japonica]|uniref:Uncharacterized protein n=1 Tax=Eumeta variegata TaxID=151549 RepID=A0A4C1Z1B9_EUMVA|nr:hypothetical protein EVAR_58897_1 [Eumeta japonica]
MIQCAGLTLPDPSFFSLVCLFYAITFMINFTVAEFRGACAVTGSRHTYLPICRALNKAVNIPGVRYFVAPLRLSGLASISPMHFNSLSTRRLACSVKVLVAHSLSIGYSIAQKAGNVLVISLGLGVSMGDDDNLIPCCEAAAREHDSRRSITGQVENVQFGVPLAKHHLSYE